jgi:zinc transporter ZupT
MIILLIIIAIMVVKVLGGLFVLKYRDKLHLILGFSAGTVLGVALFDLLPESIEMTAGEFELGVVTVLIAIGFSVYLLIDRLLSLHSHDCEKPAHNGHFSAVALIVHSFLDGLAIGMAFQVSVGVGWVVAIAILAHSFSDGINTVGVIIRGKGSQKAVLRWMFAGAIAPVVGLVVASFIYIPISVLGLILAVFVGLFLYIGASDLIPESHHNHPTLLTTGATILGLLLIYVATVGFGL